MTLQKISDDAGAVEVSVGGYVRGDDFPSSGINPLQVVLGDSWTERHVILDFSKVTEIGSAGLGWLLKTHQELQAKGSRVAIFGVKPQVAQPIKLMSVNRRVPMVDDRAAALVVVNAAAGTEASKGNP